jgi:nucleoside-diphosphate-sugar epimerase
MAKYCVIGRSGFIGGALAKRLGNVTSTPTKDCDIIFDFGSPVHMPFEENPDYYFQTLLQRHLYFLSFGVYYVWPSSALVYEEKEIAFTHFKKAMEELAKAYPNNLGLRIFPVYGVGEHRTFISQACEAMKQGKRPEVWGDGTQERDFIYIQDVIDQIMSYIAIRSVGIRDVGAGKPTSFNSIIQTINDILGTKIEPIYKSAPKGYAKGVVCQNPIPTKNSIYDGCKKILGL